MNRITGWALAGLVAAAGCAPAAARADNPKRGTYQAQKAGWMLGMYVGEGKGTPFPFVLQLDPAADAQKKGIKVGDELIKIEEDDMRVTSFSRVFERISRYREGKEVTLWVRRGSSPIRYLVRVPKAAPADTAETKKDEVKKDDKTAENPDAATGEGQDDKSKKKKKKKSVVIKPVPIDPP